MNRIGWLWWAIACLSTTTTTHPQILFDRTDQRVVREALGAILMTETDLGFLKENSESQYIRPDTLRQLRVPLTLPADAERHLVRLQPVTNLVSLVHALHPEYRPGHWRPRSSPSPFTAEVAIANIVAASQRLQFPPPDSRALAAFLLALLKIPSDDITLRAFPKEYHALRARRDALALDDDELARWCLPAGAPASLLEQRALWDLLAAVDEAVVRLKPLSADQSFERVVSSPLGKVIVGGGGPNVYREAAFLILDLGGDDEYHHAAAAGNGLAGRPVSLVIDLAGNDRYAATEPFAQATGVFGVGILVDAAGDDEFRAVHVAQAAVVHGFAILWNRGGLDQFFADQYGQGAAAFGTAILWSGGTVDDDRQTTYTASGLAQGFGGVGGTGLLLDHAGDDQYTATGYEPCGWLPGRRFTLAQGFGFGMRPWAGGGTGLLIDFAGNDSYTADVYGQGAAYWYATGMLLDGGGNDVYRAYQYCQGAGIHLAVGLLADVAGDDLWEAHAICQGGAHDYSVGMLLDRHGNDRYRGVSTAQGSAIHNSFALLLDRAGGDRYQAGDVHVAQAAGHDGGRRQYGSIALLLDLDETDWYSQEHSNSRAWIKPWYGCGWDAEFWSDNRPATPRLYIQRAPPGPTPWLEDRVDASHPIERLLRRAVSDRPDAAEAWEQLRAGGTESLRYLITRLNSPDVMVWVKTEDLVDALGDAAVPELINGIRTARDTRQARGCAYFLARFPQATNAIPDVLPLLKRPETRRTALYTLGHLGAREAIPAARRALRDADELVRMRAAQALGRIGDHASVPLLLRATDDVMWTVRYAAQDALVALRAVDAMVRAIPSASPRARPHLIEALARCGQPRALVWQRKFPLREPALQAARLRYLESCVAGSIGNSSHQP